MATPANKSKTVKLRKADLNTTKVSKSAATPKNGARNFSFLNTSISRQTLRANNRALAQNLARMKLELRQERNANMEMKSEIQELKLSVNRFERLVGLKDEQIDEEVKKRMKDQFSVIFDLVEQAVGNLFNAGKSLTELQDKCIEIQRQTPPPPADQNSFTSTSAAESEKNIGETSNSKQLRQSLNNKKGKPSDDVSTRILCDGLPPLPSKFTMPRHTDISMIEEQSILGEPDTDGQPAELPQPKEKKTSPKSATVTKMKPSKKMSKMPQRVPSKQKYQPPDFSRPRAMDKTETKGKLDQPLSDNQDPFKPSQTLHRSPMRHGSSDPVNPFKPSRTLLRSPIHGAYVRKSVGEEEESPPQKIDSRDFFASLTQSHDTGILDEPPPGPNFGDDTTMFFNANMELTSVIDITKLVPPNSRSPNVPMAQVQESTKDNTTSDLLTVSTRGNSGKTAVKSPNEKLVEQAAKTATASTEQTDNAATVEVMNLKPGVFTFSVSRKEADGSRKPVPEKKPHARSKKKPKIVEQEEEPRKTENRDMFNFGDRTPTVPLEKLQKPTATVYDVSMNESTIAPQTSLNTFRESIKDKNKHVGPDSVEPVEESSNIYYLPLKGCSDDLPNEKQSRARSRSRKRKSSSDDEDWVPTQRPKSRSRAKRRISSEADNEEAEEKDNSQPSPRKLSKSGTEKNSPEKSTRRSARSKSRQRKPANSEKDDEQPARSKSRQRKPIDSSDDEDWGPTRRPKSRSRAKRRISSEADNKEAEEKEKSQPSPRKRSKSGTEKNSPEKSTRRSARSKSRQRKPANSENDDEQPARSKSRQRKPANLEYDDEQPARSKSQRGKPTDLENDDKQPVRSKSRQRQHTGDKDEEEVSAVHTNTEEPTGSRSRSKVGRDRTPQSERVSTKSTSRPRKVEDTGNDVSPLKDTADGRNAISKPEPEEINDRVRQSARSRSRARKGDEESPRKEISKKESRRSWSQSGEQPDMAKESVRRSARSRSRPRLPVDSDKEETSSQVSSQTDSRQSRPVEKTALRQSARSRSRPRKIVISDDEQSPVKGIKEKKTESTSQSKLEESQDKDKESVKHSAGSKAEINVPADSNKELCKSKVTGKVSPRKSDTLSKGQGKTPELNVTKKTDTSKRAENHVDRKNKSHLAESLNTVSCDLTERISKPVDKEGIKSAETDPHVYYLPLKGSPSVSQKPQKSRSRSQSRSRIKESDPGENQQQRRRSERRSAHSESGDKEEALEFEELTTKVSVRPKSSRKKGTIAKEHKQSGDSGLVLPDFIINCDSPVSTGDGDNRVSEGKAKKQSVNLKEQALITDVDDEVMLQETAVTPMLETDNRKSHKSKTVKSESLNSAMQGNGKSARKQKVDTQRSRSKRKCSRDSPERVENPVEKTDKKISVRPKSSKKKAASVKEPTESGDGGLVLPEFVISPDIHTESEVIVSDENTNVTPAVSKDDKVLKDLDSNIKVQGDSDITKRSRKKTDSKKLSTKTPKTEQDDFKVPKSKSVKTKTSRKQKSDSCKSTERQKVFVADTPKGENEANPDNSAKASRKRLDQVFVERESEEERTPRQERSPASATKRSKQKNRTEKNTGHRPSDRGDMNDENEQPMNSLAKLKQKLSMISSRPRPSMLEADDDFSESEDQFKPEPRDGAAAEDDESGDSKRMRRNRPQISYCPKKLNQKLRRGDDMFEKKMSKENAEKARLLLTKKMLNP